MTDLNISLAYGYVEKAFKSGDSMNNVISQLREMGLTDKTIKECIGKYLEEFNRVNKEDTLVDKDRKFEDWYGGPSTTPTSHWKMLCSVLETEKFWKQEMIDSLDVGSNAVVKRLANPKIKLNGTEAHQSKGLVLGYVQSGKTANYSAVIAKALDAGYKFIIVLSGIHNNLRYQTEARLRKEIVVPSELKADPITKMEVNGDFNEKLTQSSNRVLGSDEGFGIAVLKKNASVLRKFNKWIGDAKKEILDATPVLIIDDESDQASINTSKDPETNQTAINKQIRNITSHFKILSYVGYTATPFANILIDTSIEEDLFPRDFIVSLKKPVSYVGAEEIFGSVDQEGNIKVGHPLIRAIDPLDEASISASKRGEDKEYEELPPSLIYALDCFFIAGAIRIARGHGKDHISMLIHGSYLQKDQEKVHALVERHVRLRRSEINRNVDETLEAFKHIRTKEFDPITKQMGQTPDKISDEDFKRNLKFFLDNASEQVILDNSASDRRLSFEEKFWGIVVGGNTLSRGLTIEGLTSTYFIRNSKMYDSLMQMGRWFGYRPGYLDLKRIFITDDLKNKFFEMASVENEIREEISVMAENNDRPIDLRIRIRQHPGMTVTAKNKMRTAVAVEYSFSGRRVQPRFLNISKSALMKNEKAIFTLIKNINQQVGSKEKSGFANFRTSLLYRGIETETILQFLDEYEISLANKRLTNSFIQNFLEKNKEIKTFNVGVLSQITDGKTRILPNGETVTLINRTPSLDVIDELDPSAVYLKGLAVPRDEMIDMYEFLQNPPENVDEVVNMEEVKRSFSFIRRKYRPKNQALLLIYPIDSKSLEKEGVLKIENEIIWGIMFVFPEEEQLSSGKYIVNSTV